VANIAKGIIGTSKVSNNDSVSITLSGLLLGQYLSLYLVPSFKKSPAILSLPLVSNFISHVSICL
jgi:hypothetical protein